MKEVFNAYHIALMNAKYAADEGHAAMWADMAQRLYRAFLECGGPQHLLDQLAAVVAAR
jgi:hypothetical protein